MNKLNRLLILIIAIVALIAVCLFVGNSEPKISVDNPARKLIGRIEAGEAYRFDGKSTFQRDGRTATGEMIIAGAPKLFYMNQVMDADNLENRVIVFYDNEKSTTIMTALESITLDTVDPATYQKLNKKAEEGVGTVDGRSVPYLSYNSETASIRYYIDGEEIYALEMKRSSSDDAVTLIVDNYSPEVPNELFQIPGEYANYRTVDNR